MAMMTVDDLARDLKAKNEDVIRELSTLGFEVEGPESSVETDDPAALRTQLQTALPRDEVIEKRIKPTVIRRRVKKKKTDRKPAREVEAKSEEIPDEVATEPSPPPDEDVPAPAEKVAAESKKAAEKASKAAPKASAKKSVKKAKKMEPAKIIEAAPPPPQPQAPKKPAAVPSQEEVEPSAPLDEKPAVTPETAAEPAQEPPSTEHEPAPAEEEAAAQPAEEAESQAAEAVESESAEAQPSEEDRAAEDKQGKKKKRKEKKLQPAQIIGKVDLKPPPQPEPTREEPKGPPKRRERPSQPPRTGPAPAASEAKVAPDAFQQPVDEERKRSKKKAEKKTREATPDRPEEQRKQVRRRKEVLLRDELYNEGGRMGRRRGKGKKPKQRKTEITTPRASKRRIKIPEVVSVADLAHKMSVKATEVIQQLLSLGVTATMNEGIDYETASIVATEFGFETATSGQSEKDLIPVSEKDTDEDMFPRPPVITMMGHVDHGKTSLLDTIRETQVTAGEAGGITQHIGAYRVKLDRGEVVFLDTPGHEAFTAMRARGAQVTDMVVLVVAADDGVMDQTREAINHARAAKVPIVVAVNKIDKPEADRDRVIRELSEVELIPEDWGGDTLFTFVSAKTGDGIEDLLESLVLQAEMMELKANPNKPAQGTVVEARLDKGKGPVATVLVQEGTLKVGDPFVAGVHYGKVRALLDDKGRNVDEAGPATPVEVHGFSGVPDAGEHFVSVEEEKVARQVSVHRHQKVRDEEAAKAGAPTSVDDLLARMAAAEVLEVNLIIKADVQGSAEAIIESLEGLSTDEVKVNVIHSGVGTVTESDVMLATASDARVIGFNVRPGPKAAELADEKNVDLRFYTVIYEALDDVRKAMEGMLAPVEKENVVGQAEVRQTFSIPKMGMIAGCYIISGKIHRANNVRLVRDGVPVYDGKIASMKRFKDDVREAQEGYECGIGLQNFNDVKIGDVIEAYVVEQEAATLS